MNGEVGVIGWTSYADAKPGREGDYEWRLPHASLEGLVLIVAAKMRERGAGYSRAISPSFDYWDGYRLHVPSGLQWRPMPEGSKPLDQYETRIIGIDGVEFHECIYCGKTPTLKGVQRAIGGGVYVGSDPHRLNSWWLQCCAWGATPHLDDPRELDRIRRAALSRLTGAA